MWDLAYRVGSPRRFGSWSVGPPWWYCCFDTRLVYALLSACSLDTRSLDVLRSARGSCAKSVGRVDSVLLVCCVAPMALSPTVARQKIVSSFLVLLVLYLPVSLP